jgi:hypothetical protein
MTGHTFHNRLTKFRYEKQFATSTMVEVKLNNNPRCATPSQKLQQLMTAMGRQDL